MSLAKESHGVIGSRVSIASATVITRRITAILTVRLSGIVGRIASQKSRNRPNSAFSPKATIHSGRSFRATIQTEASIHV